MSAPGTELPLKVADRPAKKGRFRSFLPALWRYRSVRKDVGVALDES